MYRREIWWKSGHLLLWNHAVWGESLAWKVSPWDPVFKITCFSARLSEYVKAAECILSKCFVCWEWCAWCFATETWWLRHVAHVHSSLSLSVCGTDHRKGLRRPRLPASYHGVRPRRVWLREAVLSRRLPLTFLSHGCPVLWPGCWETVQLVLTFHSLVLIKRHFYQLFKLYVLTNRNIHLKLTSLYPDTYSYHFILCPWLAPPSPPLRPNFSTLEGWLENLLLNMDMGLPLMSEVDSVQRDFWEALRLWAERSVFSLSGSGF